MPGYPPERAESSSVRAGLSSKNFIMFVAYVLKDNKGRVYKGMTNDFMRRLAEHRSGHTKTTSKMNNLELVYKEEYVTFEEARKRELYFKSAAGRKFLKKILPG